MTIDKLMKRDKIMANGWYMCKKGVESYNHILLWCHIVYELWTVVYGLLRINWVIVGSMRDELWAWEGLHKKRQVVNLIPLTIFWILWEKKKK